ncbi:sideroflexin-3-like protein [Sarcoptes scabiei]|uniref:Sideroflexin-3-like protein n=1 Tax=Sarcoptes scabiei TaxID=52283 RepID=A0A131ZYP4_SARSC|nr:sideroflexin-3-like protein [Sarcoptes scabiei]
MDRLEKRGVLARMPWISAPAQVLMCGISLTFATPLCCALFPQRKSVPIDHLEDEIQEYVRKTKSSWTLKRDGHITSLHPITL